MNTLSISAQLSEQKKHPWIKSIKRGTWLSAVCCLTHPMAHASIDIALKLDAHFGHNNNLFRAGTASTPQTSAAPVDTPFNAQSAAVTVGVPLGSEQTRLVLTTTLGHSSYGARSELNHSPQNTSISLPWRFTELWQGHLALGRTRTAYAFDALYPQLDLVDKSWARAEVRLQATPWISVPIQVAKQTIQHQDQAIHGLLDQQQQRISAALAYSQANGNKAEFGWARGTTDGPATGPGSANQSKDSDVFLAIEWAHSAQTQVGLRWTNRLRSFALTPEKDRRNLYQMGVSHTFSPLLRVDAQLWHQPVTATEISAINTTAKGQRVGLQYTPNPKWGLDVTWQKEQQDNRGFANTANAAFSQQSNQFKLRGQYRLNQGLVAYVETGLEKRNQAGNGNAQQRTFRGGVEYTFENIEGSGTRNRAVPAPMF